MSSILERFRPKGLPSSGFRYFYQFSFQVQVYDKVGSAVGFHLLKYTAISRYVVGEKYARDNPER